MRDGTVLNAATFEVANGMVCLLVSCRNRRDRDEVAQAAEAVATVDRLKVRLVTSSRVDLEDKLLVVLDASSTPTLIARIQDALQIKGAILYLVRPASGTKDLALKMLALVLFDA